MILQKVIMRKLYLFAFFLVLYEFTTYSANDMIMPGMVSVIRQFNAPLTYVAASLSLYMLGDCAVQIQIGPLSEYFGKRKIILWGCFSFLVFTIFIAFSSNILQFMTGRFLQGSGMAFVAMGYAIIHEKFNDKDSVKIIALMANITILAPLVGPIIGGIIVSYSSWHYIFIVTGILGLISFSGLYKYTPRTRRQIKHLDFNGIIKHYLEIARSKNYMLGVFCTIAGALPLLIWIGLSPNIILYNLKLGYKEYVIYQLIAVGGLPISTILLQRLAGKLEFHKLIRLGCIIAFAGILFSVIFSFSINLLAVGLFFYTLGFGLANGSIFRIIMSIDPKLSQSMSASLLFFLQTLFFAIGIEISNSVCKHFNFSSLSSSLCWLFCAIIFLFLTFKLSSRIKDRKWH